MRKNKGKTRKNAHRKSESVTGRLDITRSGMGYVIVEGQQKDILVKPSDFNKAFHGDRVIVQLNSENPKTGRLQGEVIRILERKQVDFIGQIEVNRDRAFFIPDSKKPMPGFNIHASAIGKAKDGDRVVVRFTDWLEKEKNPRGVVVSVLSENDLNDLAMKEILISSGFPLDFDDLVIEESERIPDLIPVSEIEKRKDIRDILTFTIDPLDARDFDDALSFRELRKGVYEIGVHIADVGYYVEPDTELDRSAYERGTSVYLPDRVLPMLPERISNELCSLRPHEDKLTFSCIFQITAKGEIRHYWIGRTVTHSNHRFTYEEVQEIIEQKKGYYSDELLVLNDIAQRFRKKRAKDGAINFSSQEVRFKLDEKGYPIGIVIRESKEAHQLIEEFMLLANKTVAAYVAGYKVNNRPIPFPYRVHDQPDEEKLIPFTAFARKFGHHFETHSPGAIAASFNTMLQAVQGMPEQHVLEQLGIRTMAKAMYTTDNIGHYGLGFESYCHFTSPIRRYPDILVHRILQQVLDDNAKQEKKLEQQCRHCSERERAAMESERAANKYKQVEYMKQFLGEEFDAVISGVASFGFWAETVDHKCEGLVSVFSLQDYDDFKHVETEYCLTGRRSGRTFRMGDRVRIKVIAANLAQRQLDYEWVLIADEGFPLSQKKKKK